MEYLTYALKVNIAFTVFFAGYWTLLRQETWFQARRMWLLLATGLAVALPWTPTLAPALAPMTIALPVFDVRPEAAEPPSYSWTDALAVCYAAVGGILLLQLFLRITTAYLTMRRSVHEACSFFGMIRMPDTIPAEGAGAIRIHETVHARQLHTLDVLLFEVLAAVFWVFPVWRWALREARLVHELTADAVARHQHPDYDRLILAHALGTTTDTLVHRFRSSHVKARIAMLYNDRSPRLTRRKLIFALPLLVVALLLIGWKPAPAFTPRTISSTFVGDALEPRFPGGPHALMDYLGSSIQYPWYSKEHGYQGTVVIGFTVQANGDIADAHVLQGVHADLDAEALRVVRAMPPWLPGTEVGQRQRVSLTLPIRFQLSSTDLFLDGLNKPKHGDGC